MCVCVCVFLVRVGVGGRGGVGGKVIKQMTECPQRHSRQGGKNMSLTVGPVVPVSGNCVIP